MAGVCSGLKIPTWDSRTYSGRLTPKDTNIQFEWFSGVKRSLLENVQGDLPTGQDNTVMHSFWRDQYSISTVIFFPSFKSQDLFTRPCWEAVSWRVLKSHQYTATLFSRQGIGSFLDWILPQVFLFEKFEKEKKKEKNRLFIAFYL